jgi:hypothetical protein
MEAPLDILNWQSVQPSNSLAQRLESQEIVSFAPCPFVLPHGDDRTFLCAQRPTGFADRNINYDPRSGTTNGFARQSTEQAERLNRILGTCASSAISWLGQLLPGYARNGSLDLVSFRAEEEATRKVSHGARNDLLHIDAHACRPTQGRRILRLLVNLHASEPRVWATSESFADVWARFGQGLKRDAVGPWTRALKRSWNKLFHPGEPEPSAYDEFMSRLHHVLMDNDDFQEKARKKFHHFPAGTAWLAFTDGLCHAELRGQFALDFAFLVEPQDLALPDLAPVNRWQGKQPSTPTSRAA